MSLKLPHRNPLFLLDTHAFLWWLTNDSRLPDGARAAIQASEILFSFVSAWEISIKVSIGKMPDLGDLSELFANETFTPLEISMVHIHRYKTLPLNHRDPFDRMLIAQALVEDAVLISNETVFDAYGVRRLWE